LSHAGDIIEPPSCTESATDWSICPVPISECSTSWIPVSLYKLGDVPQYRSYSQSAVHDACRDLATLVPAPGRPAHLGPTKRWFWDNRL